jgi:predicted membrane-bound dolichyl-phosphate-mannose-protein mannosyltransferase
MRPASAKLTLILSLIAAVLALSAVVVRYTRDGDIRWSLVGAAVFILAFGVGVWSRR